MDDEVKHQTSSLTQSILQAHNDSVAEVADEASVVQQLGGRAGDEIAPMDPNHHGQQMRQRGAEVQIQRDKDVEIETVLTDLNGDTRGHIHFSLHINNLCSSNVTTTPQPSIFRPAKVLTSYPPLPPFPHMQTCRLDFKVRYQNSTQTSERL